MTGGMIWPPVEETHSTAAAKWLLYPMFFIIGIVKVPVPITLAVELPEMVPKKALEILLGEGDA